MAKCIAKAALLAGAALVTFALSGCATREVAGTEPVTRGYAALAQSWSTGIRVVYVARLRKDGDRTAVCGAMAYNTGTGMFREEFFREMVDRVRVYYGTDRLLTGFRGLGGPYEVAELDDARQILGREARCVTTSEPWQSQFANKALLRIEPTDRITITS